jgi:hypothetical protein
MDAILQWRASVAAAHDPGNVTLAVLFAWHLYSRISSETEKWDG